MRPLLFSGNLLVEIEGPRVLTLVERFSEYAEYTVVGFQEHVILRDFRITGLTAIDHVLMTNDVSQFPSEFNGHAYAKIFDFTDSDPLVIELREPTDDSSRYLLWIVVGLGEEVPVYEYLFGLEQPLNDKQYAFIAVADLEDEKPQIVENKSYSSSDSVKSSHSLPLSPY